MWGGCSDALKKRLKSLLRRARKLILPDKNLTNDQQLNKIGILSLHKQLNKGVFMYRALTNNAPVYRSSLYKAPHSSSRNNYLQLSRPRTDLLKTSIAFSDACFGMVCQYTSDHVTHSTPSSETSVSTVTQCYKVAVIFYLFAYCLSYLAISRVCKVFSFFHSSFFPLLLLHFSLNQYFSKE